MQRVLTIAPVLIMLALAGAVGTADAATIFTGKGGATCTFENCLAYCTKVSGVKCAAYCNKVIPERHRDGTCK